MFVYILTFIKQFVFRLKMPKKLDFVFILTIKPTSPNNIGKIDNVKWEFWSKSFVLSVSLFSGY